MPDTSHHQCTADVADSQRVFHEEALSLAQAARRLPSVRGKKPPHPATLFRWATAGRKSRTGIIVRLEVWKVGGTNCTSIEALARFFNRLSDVESVNPPNSSKTGTMERQVEEAEKILRQRGLMD